MNTPHHIDKNGHARMVDVGAKQVTERRALAQGYVSLAPDTFQMIKDNTVPKGDVLAAARIAGIMAAKKTPDLIPLCHQVALSSVTVQIELRENDRSLRITAEAKANDQTGVEMEALTAVTVAGLTIYDMLKSMDRAMALGPFTLLEKEGGRSDAFSAGVRVVAKTDPAESRPRKAAKSSSSPQAAPPRSRASIHRKPKPSPSQEVLSRAGFVKQIDSNRPELSALLQLDPIGSSYMLSDLDTPYAEHCDWHGLDDDGLRALLLVYRGLRMPALLTKGTVEDVAAILSVTEQRIPERFYFAIPPEHKQLFEDYFELTNVRPMSRMGLTREDYNSLPQDEGVKALSHRDTAAIMKLYEHYPDNFFEPHHLGTGYYFGIREKNDLISVAGIHNLSDRYNIAAIGNIVTHLDHRGQGLAYRCVRRLLDELFTKVKYVSLNVGEDNQAAIACYSKLGFSHHRAFIEGWASR